MPNPGTSGARCCHASAQGYQVGPGLSGRWPLPEPGEGVGGKTVLLGLIDAHVHELEAVPSEFRTSLPRFDSIAAILDYLRDIA